MAYFRLKGNSNSEIVSMTLRSRITMAKSQVCDYCLSGLSAEFEGDNSLYMCLNGVLGKWRALWINYYVMEVEIKIPRKTLIEVTILTVE